MNCEEIATGIARELDHVAFGMMRYCPECGMESDSTNADTCPDCGTRLEEMTIGQYPDNDHWYNDRIKVASDDPATVMDGSVMIACGGPNVWVNTEKSAIEVYWGLDCAIAMISKDSADEVRAVLQDVWTARLYEGGYRA